MPSLILAVTVVVATGALLQGCTSSDPTPEDSSAGSAGVGTVTGSAPIMFAFTCRTGSGAGTETYTTYSAVWEDRRAECTAFRTTGSVLSTQQAAAVRAARGAAALDELAAGCAVRGAGAWVRPVTEARAADIAAGLLAYCPGHPEHERLREALATYRS
ncbi:MULTISPECIES: hypothetical protein [unclassified Curtobacterium]|nr:MULTISPECIES: hypothetical protein [unclassified Curtobacterium]